MAKTQAELNAEIDAAIIDNHIEFITPARLRGVLHDIVGAVNGAAAPLATPHPSASISGIPRDNAQTNPPTIESPAPMGFFC